MGEPIGSPAGLFSTTERVTVDVNTGARFTVLPKLVGEDHEIVERDAAVAVQVVSCLILLITLPVSERACEQHEVRKVHTPVAVEVGGRGRGELQGDAEGRGCHL